MPRGTDGHVLTGTGVGSDPAYETVAEATKDIFVPIIVGSDMSVGTAGQLYGGCLIDASGELGRGWFRIPDNYSSLTSLHLAIIAKGTVENMTMIIRVIAAAHGESISTHYGTTDPVLTVESGYRYEVDISSAWNTDIAVGDIVQILIEYKTNTDMEAHGARFKYA